MKKLSVLIICCVTFSSCYTTHNVVSKTSLDRTIDSVAIELKSNGYYPVGTSMSPKNELTVTGQSYTKYAGYGTRLDNNYITSDTYRFADTLGNSMDYTVSYQLNKTSDVFYHDSVYDGFYFVTELQVTGCETSNPKEYEKLCGKYSPTKKITYLYPDKSVEVYNKGETLTGVVLTTVICTIIGLIIYSSGVIK